MLGRATFRRKRLGANAAHQTDREKPRNEFPDGGEMTLYPALTLALGPLGACRERAGNPHERKEVRRFAYFRQIESQLQIFHQMTAGQRNGADRVPRKHHSCPHQLNRAMKIS